MGKRTPWDFTKQRWNNLYHKTTRAININSSIYKIKVVKELTGAIYKSTEKVNYNEMAWHNKMYD